MTSRGSGRRLPKMAAKDQARLADHLDWKAAHPQAKPRQKKELQRAAKNLRLVRARSR